MENSITMRYNLTYGGFQVGDRVYFPSITKRERYDSGTVIAGKFTEKLQSGWRWRMEQSTMLLIQPDDGTPPFEVKPKDCYFIREVRLASEEEK